MALQQITHLNTQHHPHIVVYFVIDTAHASKHRSHFYSMDTHDGFEELSLAARNKAKWSFRDLKWTPGEDYDDY